MNFFKSRLNEKFGWLLVLLTAINFSGCPRGETLEEELARRHPRKEQPLLKTMPPVKKKLVGLFVDAQSKASSPDGKSWGTAFVNITDAINVSTGQRIYVAAGTYKRPNLIVHDRRHIHLVGGYKAGELYEKENFDTKGDAWTILDGDAQPQSLMTVSGLSDGISFLGGFVFQNVAGAPAINIVGTAAQPVKNITIVACRFENNNSGGVSGGGIHVEHAEDIRFDAIDARNNRSNADGGFIYALRVKGGSISRGAWENNRAANDGGGLFAEANVDLVVGGQVIKSNHAARGGGIFLRDHHNQILKNIDFNRNQSAGNGAAIVAENSNDLKLLLGQSEVKGNRGRNGGAIAVSNGRNLTIVGGKFSDNRATRSGGTIAVEDVDGIAISDCAIDDSHSVGNGGGAFLLRPGGRVDVTRVTVSNARAGKMGGGFFIGGAHAVAPTITIANSHFEKNHSVGNGGALATRAISYKITVSNTVFKENATDNYGGALALDGRGNPAARFVIGEGTKFNDNGSAKNFGGGAILAVFDHHTAAMPLPPPTERQLVFFNTSNDLSGNHAGDGQAGQFLRVTKHHIKQISPAAPEQKGALPSKFLANIPGSADKVLSYFIPYSMVIGHTAPWDRLKLDWERVSSSEQVYAW